MKKLPSVLVALLPVIYIAAIFAAFCIQPEDELLFAILAAYALLGFFLPVIYCITTAKECKKFMAVSNVCFYAGNLLLFAAEIVFLYVYWQNLRIAEQNGAMEGGLGLVIWAFLFLPHWLSYLCTRIVGAVCCARTLKGVCSTWVKELHILLQLFPVADLLSAVWVCLRLKRSHANP